MENKRIAAPGIINRIDKNLLKNSPVTWSTRIHLALYYGLGFGLIVLVLSFIAPDDPRSYSRIGNWVTLLSIISLLAFIFWMIYLLRFNVFKRYGKWQWFDTVKTFLLYFLTILVIVSWPYIPPIVQSVRANAAYSADELVTDINNMNLKLCLLEKDSLQTAFTTDTVQVHEELKGTYENEYTVSDIVVAVRYNYIDTASLRTKLSSADSVVQLNDSVYVFLDCPDYTYVNNYEINNDPHLILFSSMELYRRTFQQQNSRDSMKLVKELASLFSKYSNVHSATNLEVSYDGIYANERPALELNQLRIVDKYDLYEVQNRIENITKKKYRWDSDSIEAFWRIAYYITLALSLLVLIYRHSTRRTFFLSLLTAVVLCILTGLFLAISYTHEGVFFGWVIGYFILFSAIAATIAGAGQRNAISGIGLNLLIFITPFMPLALTASYYRALREKYDRIYDVKAYHHYFRNESLHYFLAEIGGFVLLVILLATIYQKAYKKWYSLPEQ